MNDKILIFGKKGLINTFRKRKQPTDKQKVDIDKIVIYYEAS